MTMQIRTGIRAMLTAAAAAMMLGVGHAQAQDYPNRPIRFIVGFAVGGSSDVVARIIGQRMSDILGVAIPVENRTGANGTLAMRLVAQAEPDGYTMTIAGATVMAITPHTTANLGYDPVKDFIGISTVSKSPIVIAAHPSVKATNLKELAEVAKGGNLTMGSSGVGGIAHLAIEMFDTALNVKVIHVPYTGGGPAANDVLAGHTLSLAMDLAPLRGHIEAGKMRAIAVVGANRSVMLPDTPTAIEQGFPSMSADNWYAIVVPAKTPKAIVDKLHAAVVQAVADPAVKQKLRAIGSETMSMASPAEFPPFLDKEIERWGGVVRAAGLEKKK
jgi:tripartite-type tricarboxylate transporter receptor subunit TctC